jgi:hypothetical protein
METFTRKQVRLSSALHQQKPNRREVAAMSDTLTSLQSCQGVMLQQLPYADMFAHQTEWQPGARVLYVVTVH